MSNKKAKKQSSSSTSINNLKALNAALAQDASISELMSDIKSLRKRVEAVILAKQTLQQKKAEEVQKIAEQKPPVSQTAEKKTVQATTEEITKVALDQSEKKQQAAIPRKNVAKPAPKTQKVEEKKTYTPSYIRGEVIPPPAPPPTTKTRKPKKDTLGKPSAARTPKPDSKRPAGKQPARVPVITPPPAPTHSKRVDKKKDYNKGEIRKPLNKRTLIRKGFITENEERMGSRKLKNKKAKSPTFVAPKIEKAVITTENLTVKMLSEKIGKTAQEIIKQLMILGIMTNINSVVDFPTMELVANELGVELELKLEQTKESLLEEQHDEESDKPEDLVKRPPIITVMGHVDHGKTSLLDAIRKTSVVTGEAGGITQHIGAYSVKCKGEKITFLDTPGHEAFTELRKRGANVTDIAILIVAADDGVMPQTVEAINHAKAAKVSILVAINKIDKPTADVERIKQELTAYELVPEEWGGDTIMVPISAKHGQGIDNLLEMVLLLAEVHEFKANPNRNARAFVVEAKLDKGKGPVANVIIQNGTLKVGDFVVSGLTYGRVRAMIDEKGNYIKEAPPSTPVSILGFDQVPDAGDIVYVVGDEKMAKQVIDERKTKLKNEQANKVSKVTLDDLISKHKKEQLKEFNIIIKGDVQGSVEALKVSLLKLENEEIRVNIPHSGVGAINKSDVMLAEVSNALVIGFNVRPDAESKNLAEKSGIEIKLYDIIYEAIDDVERMIKGLREPQYRLVTIGRAQVRNVFKLSSAGMVAGSYVLDGKIQRGALAKVYRDGEVIHEGQISGLKRFKDDVREVATGYECGISINGYDVIKENDEIEAIIQEEIKN